MPVWLKEKLNLKSPLKRELAPSRRPAKALPPLLFTGIIRPMPLPHFFRVRSSGRRAVSRWSRRMGDHLSMAGEGNRLEPQWEIEFPHSLGMLYSAFTYYTGFKVNSGEYKVMGLAPYGEPKYAG